jgi:hypothetical protein
MVVLLLRPSARRGRWCPWDGASATFSTPGSVLSRFIRVVSLCVVIALVIKLAYEQFV